MPNLLYLINSLNPGGTERLAAQMSLAFAAEFNVSVICLDEPGVWGVELRRKGIPVYCLWRQPGLDLSVALKLAQYCKQQQIDIIHAHQCTPWFYAGLSRWIYGAPRLVFEEHGRFFPEVLNHKRIVANKLAVKPRTHRLIAVSEDVKTRLIQYEGLPEEQIEVVYNGVSPPAQIDGGQREKMRRELGFGPDDFVVGSVGRFDPIKNLPLLVRSLAAAREQVPRIRGLLVGDGPLFDEIAALRDALGLESCLAMTGHREDARELVQCMDLFVLSSFSEGTSVALLEAMSAGVPAAVTAVGGNPEIVVAGETGWVVPSDSSQELTAVLVDAATNPEKTARRGAGGQRRFLVKFTFDRMMENYRRIYAQELSTSDRICSSDSPLPPKNFPLEER